MKAYGKMLQVVGALTAIAGQGCCAASCSDPGFTGPGLILPLVGFALFGVGRFVVSLGDQ